ncbi:MAG: tRNA modification GTPase MnmE [Chlamydiae bacterium]|nr:tRNA modification GTPase MnmE [Chlamydiota bacterium]
MNLTNHTIAAIATPPGDGGVAIIRLSGPLSVEIVSGFFSKSLFKLESNKLYFGTFFNADRSVLDQGMVVVMRAPHSYTGEEVVEIHCHGGHFLSKKVLQRALDLGADIAKPGEFTERAFLNGKMDLAQAEAVQTLISAKNDYALKSALGQLEGGLSQKIKQFQNHLIEVAAVLEAWVDFPEEGIEFTSLEEMVAQLETIQIDMSKLMDTYDQGRVVHEGFTICLAGKPNVGKSSLMNALLKRDRALVTPIAGTTRDTLEEALCIDGMIYRLIDTAGIRQTNETVEKLGIERASQTISQADLVLLVLDASARLTAEDQKLVERLKDQKVLVIWNKCDISLDSLENLPFSKILHASAQTGLGLGALYKQIPALLMEKIQLTDEIYLSQIRHKKALQEAREWLSKVILGLKSGESPEWLTFDLKSSLKALSSIIGFNITESILSNIFSRFCIGK